MKLIWLPTWRCGNYAADGGPSERCPYCSLGYREGRLTVWGQPRAAEAPAEPAIVQAWLDREGHRFDVLDLSGGEPLNYLWLGQSLARWPRGWAITSSTVQDHRVRSLVGVDWSRCLAWTASYHPLSGRDQDFADGVAAVRAMGAQRVYCTVVSTPATAPAIRQRVAWLEGLGFDRINLHLDMYGRGEPDFEPPAGWLVVEETRRRRDFGPCRVHDEHVVLAPNGRIYPCVEYAYRDAGALGSVADASLTLRPGSVEHCPVPCALPCDVGKWAIS